MERVFYCSNGTFLNKRLEVGERGNQVHNFPCSVSQGKRHFRYLWTNHEILNEISKKLPNHLIFNPASLNPLIPNSDENEISLHINIYLFQHSSDENKESDHQG